MCSQQDIDYHNILQRENDRQRELKRQIALKQVRATAHLYRNLPTEPGFQYSNSNGDRVS